MRIPLCYSFRDRSGQVVLTVVVFMVVLVVITTGATLMTVTNTKSTTVYAQGVRAYALAESGAENALMRLLRDPAYTGETLVLEDGTAEVTVSFVGDDGTVVSTGTVGNYERTIEVDVSYNNNILSIIDWRE
jgi:hypothetical protein